MYIDTENSLSLRIVDGQVLLQHDLPPEDEDEPYSRETVSKLFKTPDEAAKFAVSLLTKWMTGKDEESAALDEIYGAKKK